MSEEISVYQLSQIFHLRNVFTDEERREKQNQHCIIVFTFQNMRHNKSHLKNPYPVLKSHIFFEKCQV